MPSKPTPEGLRPAPLADPFYYLRNFQSVVSWCRHHHGDLLLAEEQTQLDRILALSLPAMALLARMTMRKGHLFRTDKLRYAEITDLDSALAELVQQTLVRPDPPIQALEIAQLCRRAELHQLLLQLSALKPDAKSVLGASAGKAELSRLLVAQLPDQQDTALGTLWPAALFSVVALETETLLERVRLMFFGNMRQDWSEFVLAELGVQSYENVPFTADSRAFHTRDEVDYYLTLHHCQQALTEAAQQDVQTDAGTAVPPLTPPPASTNPWLEHRRQRLLLAMGQHAERGGRHEDAANLYRQCHLGTAWVRYFRMREKQPEATEALLHELSEKFHYFPQPEVQLHLGRVAKRLQKKVADVALPSLNLQRTAPIRQQQLELMQQPDQSVEMTVRDQLSTEETPVYYVENHLFPGLLGLLLWPVLFAPLPGAFFHPFQSGPADLYREDFVSRRRDAIEARLASLQDGSYRDHIRQCYQAKHGMSCSLIFWPALSETLIEQALDCIAPQKLLAIFRHLLLDLRHHRRGMPDLIQFNLPQRDVELIEVKGPGDRLQDHQTLWLNVFNQLGVKASVAQVRWRDPTPQATPS
ncbi:VRR-NUC domain-containing protein [Spongiibacter taiwanensis]|uniref:VRR-NUC domain-containing protein n=1 Tax=Spongiibacter taiwanensis TaxID=1748242 RepID=UPI0020355C5B|nr:VRR-NUC domain-containing protein [Spongiibacter taiwanensis]USA43725.1 VRR-NUC domain-containing protein [Spongiibacter taiwanensis]